MVNMTQIPEVIAGFLNIPDNTGGMIIAIAVTIGVCLAIAVLSDSEALLVLGGGSCLGFFTLIEWFPIWISILIALGVAVVFGKQFVSNRTNSGGM